MKKGLKKSTLNFNESSYYLNQNDVGRDIIAWMRSIDENLA
jgi:hypothetical protein